ncbi:basic salivary proline-rich protein 2-like [Bos javanicus]|uniref:basic salivary proline-rich protein 2-like n=1 Tax=Bos javanicus TaxID=9906 RepID=UPI002AA68255|nr:basic salivary proline-rich protein 2-like [Bos javanicus]
MAPAPGRQLWPPAAAQLKYSGSRSQSRGCGRQGRKVALPPSAWSPSAHHGGEGNGRCGERARPLRTHTLPCRASGTRHRSRSRRRPLSDPPSRAVAEFSLQTPPSRWRLPLPATPSTVPSSKRRGAAILSPVPPPPRRYLHSENRPGRPAAFTSRLQPSPPCQASPPRDAPGRPRHRPGAPRPSPGPPGNPPPTPARLRSAPPPPLKAAGLLPGPNCGLLGACSAPRATPPGLARKGATRAADQAGTRPLRAG